MVDRLRGGRGTGEGGAHRGVSDQQSVGSSPGPDTCVLEQDT